jgi:hypothetical protein
MTFAPSGRSTSLLASGPPLMRICCRTDERKQLQMMYCVSQLAETGECWWHDDPNVNGG